MNAAQLKREKGPMNNGWKVPTTVTYIALVFFLSLLYFASHAGIRDTNEGAHYALLASYLTDRNVNIDKWVHLSAWGNDFAYNDGHFRTDRSPGTALVLAPYYLLGQVLSPFFHDQSLDWAREHSVYVGSAIVGALSILLLIMCAIELGLSSFTSWLVGLTVALTTFTWKYSSHIFAHVFTTSCFLLTLLLILRERHTESKPRNILIGVLTGSLLLFAYEASFLIPALLLIRIVISLKFESPTKSWLRFVIGLAVPLSLLGLFHTANWGAPWRIYGPFNSPFHAGNHDVQTFFSKSLSTGLNEVLWNAKPMACPRGLFYSFPILLAGIPGLFFFKKRQPAVLWSWLTSTILFILFFAKRADNTGGSCCQVRHLLPVVPFFAVSLGFFLEDYLFKLRNDPLRAVITLCLAFFAIGGGLFMVLHFITFHGHDFDFKRDIAEYSLASMTTINAVLQRLFVAESRTYSLFFTIWGTIFSSLAVLKAGCKLRIRVSPSTRSVSVIMLLATLSNLLFIAKYSWTAHHTSPGRFGTACVRRASAESILDLVSFASAAERPTGFLSNYSNVTLPIELALNEQSTGVEVVSLSTTMNLNQAQTIKISGVVDDEIRILVDGKTVAEILGPHGGEAFNFDLEFPAQRSQLTLLYSNLGGGAKLSLQSDDPAIASQTSCEGRPGFCQSRYQAASVFEFPSLASYLARNPVQEVELPVKLHFRSALEFIQLVGTITNTADNDLTARLNYLYDDAAELEIDGKMIESNYSPRYSWGTSREIVLSKGTHTLRLLQANLSGSGDLWLHMFRNKDKPINFRCPETSEPQSSVDPQNR